MSHIEGESSEAKRLRGQLNEAHGLLLAVHKALLDHERARYEQTHGRIASAGEVLRLVIGDPFFQWLRPLTVMITQIDELTEGHEPLDTAAATALLGQLGLLLNPDEAAGAFQRDYFRALQESPVVAEAHGQWMRILRSAPPSKNPMDAT